ncbi:Short-chain dehydrogenase [Frankia sp. AiPs1]|uniref:SDR family NAD(P)-dependent oxidoreductase n=1 Tax=Frankia sp. AiPa1 TaxID=573492 RepID=UPI00202ADFD4|nr:SDR family NAD(P)-dependent oxidoreductase [Frankia sp. AiPa1]MCL9760489.1 SDR family NAD(P)-dependent oxidoreductase [Frankia sp. AiPa1]
MGGRDRDVLGWSPADVPDLGGRRVVITGADSGLGFETARVLAGHGATVVLACRDVPLAEAAAAHIRSEVAAAGGPSTADVRVQHLDLASLGSVYAAAGRIRAEHPRIDLLINNAGVMRPDPAATQDGFDPTLGINYLGHFALTGLLLDRLLAATDSRVVMVSSLAHHIGRISPVDLARVPAFSAGQSDRPRVISPAANGSAGGRLPYPASKLAMLMFAFELQRRLDAAGASTIAVAAHPGVARTGLGRGLPTVMRAFMADRMQPVMGWLIHGAQAGALASIRAAVDPSVRGGEFYGPNGLFGATGTPAPARAGRAALHRDRQRLLWAESERITGVTYRLG